MVKVKALITLVISDEEQIKVGETYECDDKEAKKLIERGFAEKISDKKPPTPPPANTPPTNNPPADKDPDDTGGNNPPHDNTGDNKNKGQANDKKSVSKSGG